MTAPAAPLALPSGAPGSPTRPDNILNITTLILVTGGLALFGALMAAYYVLGQNAAQWPPKGITLDDYIGSMLTITAVMSAMTVEWAAYAIKREDPAQASWGLGLTALFGLAFLDLLWFLGRSVNFGPGDTKIGPFAVVFFALIVATGFVTLLGVVAVLSALARALGRQMTAGRHQMIRAVAWYWDFVVVAWIAVYSAIWLLR